MFKFAQVIGAISLIIVTVAVISVGVDILVDWLFGG